MQFGRSVPLLTLLGCLVPAAFLPAPDKQSDKQLPLVCPAVKHADKPFLAFVGTPTPIAGQGERFEIQIDRLLSGSWDGSGVEVLCRNPLPPQCQVVVLVPDQNGIRTRSLAKELCMQAGQEKDLLALGQAEIDSFAATAPVIVVARELQRESTPTPRRLVEVVRPLANNQSRPGQKLWLEVSYPVELRDTLPVNGQPEAIYILDNSKTGDGKTPEAPILFCRPVSHEAAVVAAIKRRATHPIVVNLEDMQRSPQREILFRGSIAEAIQLVGSNVAAVVTLGRRRLLYEQTKDPTLLSRLLLADITRAGEPLPGRFRGLRNLIALAGDLQRNGGKANLIEPLLNQELAHLTAQPKPPMPTRRQERELDLIGEEDQEDVNHALLWLLQQRDEKTRNAVEIPRVRRLRDASTGFARREAQLVLDVFGIEEREAIERARHRMQGTTPAWASALLRLDKPLSVCFSRDGQFLAGTGNQEVVVWNTKDCSVAARVPLKTYVYQLCFT